MLTMKISLLFWLASSTSVNALAFRAVEERAAADCNNPAFRIISTVLSYYGSSATRLCSDILKRGPGPTTTIGSVTTTTLVSGSTVSTIKSGVTATTIDSTLSLQTGSTQTITNVNTISTITSVIVATTVTTSTSVTTASTSTSTSYVPVYIGPPSTAAANAAKRDLGLEQRAAATTSTTSHAAAATTTAAINKATSTSNAKASTTAAPNNDPDSLGRRYPGAPKQLLSLAYSAVSKACDCFIPVTTATVSSVSVFTSNVPATILTTIPSSTLTVTNTVTTFSDVGSITTTVTALTVTNTVPLTSTSTTVTTTTVVPAAATKVVTVTYNKQIEQNTCVYNRYYDYPDVSNDPTNNYAAGINQCSGLCSSNPNCKFFFFLKFDPAKARGYDAAGCILDDQPYSPDLLQCGYVSSYSVGYNKGTVVSA